MLASGRRTRRIPVFQERARYSVSMVDIDLLLQALRNKGHVVTDVNAVPENAGTYELTVDGTVLNLEEARAWLEAERS